MTPVTKHHPIIEDWSDDRLAAALQACERVINRGLHDPHFGRPSRETVLARLAANRASIAAQVTAAADAIVRELARSESPPDPNLLANYAALRALADDEDAWRALSAQVAAPVDSHSSDPFGWDTDAQAAAARAERQQELADAQNVRPLYLADTRRRRVAAERAEQVRVDAERRRTLGRS